jgi:ABC-type uncharacterized transport system substrate-binding protein
VEVLAHPHVFVVVKSELIYGENGTLKEIKYAWTFDEMYSAFASQGLDENNDGKISAKGLSELAENTVPALKENGYFTKAKIGGKPIAFVDAANSYFETDEKGVLTLHFTLPVQQPTSKGVLTLEIYDPEYYVAMTLVENKSVSLSGAPPGCVTKVNRANDSSETFSEEIVQQLNAGVSLGSKFANTIIVRCP